MNDEMKAENEETARGKSVDQQEDSLTTDQPERIGEECIIVEGYQELSEEKEMVDRIIKIMKGEEEYRVLPFKKVDRLNMNEITAKVNKLVARIQTDSITETNKLLKAVRTVVVEKIGLREVNKQTKKKEP